MTPLEEAQYVRSLLVRAIEEKGADYRYQPPGGPNGACMYNHDDAPSCIAGHVFAYHGVRVPDVLEGSSAWTVTKKLTDWSELVGQALSNAQAKQDVGHPWGEALMAFDAELERVGLVA